MKYHVKETGKPGVCTAQAGNCPLSGEDEHYSDYISARIAYEKKHNSLPPKNKKPSKNRPLSSYQVKCLTSALKNLEEGDWASAQKTYYSAVAGPSLEGPPEAWASIIKKQLPEE